MSQEKEKPSSVAREIVYTVLVVLSAVILIRTTVVQAFYIPSGSMEDTLLVGDYLLANKFVYGAPLDVIGTSINLGRLPGLRDPQPGDIVIFRSPTEPDKDLIKRCVAVGGQKVEIVNKRLMVDGKPFEDPPEAKYADRRLLSGETSTRDNLGPFVVPEGHFFMMGDNRDNSADGRVFGPIPKKLIKGKAMMIYWSWASDNRPPYYTGLASLPAVVATSIWRLPSRVRLGRMGDVIH
jgi:signal peptidase I